MVPNSTKIKYNKALQSLQNKYTNSNKIYEDIKINKKSKTEKKFISNNVNICITNNCFVG